MAGEHTTQESTLTLGQRVDDLHGQLSARFEALKEGRQGVIYFIEHGMDAEEVSGLFEVARAALKRWRVGEPWWEGRALPLIVAATEVGYTYRGAGTEFWPTLDAALDATLRVDERAALRDMFARAAEAYRGVTPPDSSWAEAFKLIAWPITHALAPIDLHYPLAQALAALGAGCLDLTDDALHRGLRAVRRARAARFEAFLATTEPCVSVARGLLGAEVTGLSAEVLQRVRVDLEADQRARREVMAARLSRGAPTRPGAPPTRQGQLVLRRGEADDVTLAASFKLEAAQRATLIRALRRRRYSPQLWGCAARVTADHLLSGVPFTLQLSSIPPPSRPLLGDLDMFDQELRGILRSMRLDVTPPLLFAFTARDDGAQVEARHIRGSKISGARRCWLLVDPEAPPAAGEARGAVGPYARYELDPARPRDARALEALGYQVYFNVSAEVVGPPPLEYDGALPRYLEGEALYISPRAYPPGGLDVRSGEVAVRLTRGEVAAVTLTAGAPTLEHDGRGAAPLEVARGASPPHAPCDIGVCAGDLTVQALLSGALSFYVDSVAPLDGLALTCVIDARGRAFEMTAALGALPREVTCRDEPLASLLTDDELRRALINDQGARVTLRVGNVAARELELSYRARPCWWVDIDGAPSLLSEGGPLAHGVVTASAPAGAVEVGEPSRDEASLLAPRGVDEQTYGAAAPFVTLCVAPARLPWRAALVEPRLTRRKRAVGGGIGVEALAEGYLRWSEARSANATAELHRVQVALSLERWLVRATCGEAWAQREPRAPVRDPWRDLVSGAEGVGRDPYVTLGEEDARALAGLAAREVRGALPWLWVRLGALNDEDYEALDVACGRAYERLAQDISARGDRALAGEVADADPGASPEEWDAALARVRRRFERHSLVELLTPTSGVAQLMALDPAMMGLGELAEELHRWAHEHKRALVAGAPAVGTLEALLALWSEPSVAVTRDWRAALDVLIADRAVARVTRYVALVRDRARRGELL